MALHLQYRPLRWRPRLAPWSPVFVALLMNHRRDSVDTIFLVPLNYITQASLKALNPLSIPRPLDQLYLARQNATTFREAQGQNVDAGHSHFNNVQVNQSNRITERCVRVLYTLAPRHELARGCARFGLTASDLGSIVHYMVSASYPFALSSQFACLLCEPLAGSCSSSNWLARRASLIRMLNSMWMSLLSN